MKRILIPLIAMLAAVLACGPLGGSEPVDEAPAEGVGAQPESAEGSPEEEAGEEPAGESVATYIFEGLGLDDHNSFSFDFHGSITPVDQSVEGQADFSGTMAVQREPQVAQWELLFERPEETTSEDGTTFGSGGLVGYLVDGTLYSVIEADGVETCVGFPDSGNSLEDTMGIFSGPDSFSDPSYHTEEMVLVESGVDANGFTTDHYRAENVNNEDVQDGTVDIWVIQGDDVPARMIMTGVVDDDDIGLANVEWNYDLLSLDQPLEVTVPDNCTTFGGGDS